MKLMKNLFVSVLLLVLGHTLNSQAQVQITVAGGFLKDQTSQRIPYNTGLLLLVASTTDSSFAAPTSTSFASGDDQILFKVSIAGDGNFNAQQDNGEFYVQQQILLSNFTNLSQGDPLMIYWYPSLNINSTAPGANTPYGKYQGSLVSSDGDGSDPWTTPADNSTITLIYVTKDGGSSIHTGTSDTDTGRAGFVTAVPEPSIYALLGSGGLVALCTTQYRRLKLGV